jgi:serine/threonine protein phosphatase PrpC
MQGWRKSMEDAHITNPNLMPNFHLFGIMDGHGGSEVAQFVQNNLPEIIKKSKHIKAKQWKELMNSAFAELDQSLLSEKSQKELAEYFKVAFHDEYSMAKETDVHKRVGCTACISLITDSEVVVANAGDSRCVLGRKGTAIEMSNDHKPNLESEKQRILKAGGTVEDNRVNGVLNLSRSIGDFDFKLDKKLKNDQQLIISTPEVKIEKISEETDFIVIACDGLWEVWESQKVVDFIYSRMTPSCKLSQIIDDMFEKIISIDANTNKLGCDNMSCIIVQFKR